MSDGFEYIMDVSDPEGNPDGDYWDGDGDNLTDDPFTNLVRS